MLGKEDKKVIDKEIKCLCYLGILKEGFFPYSSPVNAHKLKIDAGQKSGDEL